MSAHRDNLLNIFNHALQSVNGRRRVEEALRQNKLVGPTAVIAIGKAAVAMANGAQAVLGDQIIDGLIITKHGYAEKTLLPLLEAGHPVPDQDSLHAGHELLSLLARLADDVQVLLLISGGTSALVEVLPEGLDDADLRKINQWLLASGLDIARLNCVRKSISTIKGGRLARYLGKRACRCLMISDVIGDDPGIIGSGLVTAPADASIDLADISMPDWLRALTGLAEPPLAADDCFTNISTEIITHNRHACEAAADCARQLGYDVLLHPEPFRSDADSTGQRLASAIVEGGRMLHIWGGESVVSLPDAPGQGGRNQQLALSAATILVGHAGCYLLAVGTDGSDGPTDDAGGLVDSETLARGEFDELNADDCLRGFDAGTFLQASGDLITTGPTGSNVMDIVLGLKTG